MSSALIHRLVTNSNKVKNAARKTFFCRYRSGHFRVAEEALAAFRLNCYYFSMIKLLKVCLIPLGINPLRFFGKGSKIKIR